MQSTLLRLEFDWRNSLSINPNASVVPGEVSAISETVFPRIAALRRSDENSSAKIFIDDSAFGFFERLNPHLAVPHTGWRRIEPAFNPFDHRDAVARMEVLLQSGADHLRR